MRTITTAYLNGCTDAHIRLDEQVTRTFVGVVIGGSTMSFCGPRDHLLALFRAIETSLLEYAPDANVHFGSDSEQPDEEPF